MKKWKSHLSSQVKEVRIFLKKDGIVLFLQKQQDTNTQIKQGQ